ncbi:zinc finger CCHC domain-containing protein 7 isoform X1 [Meleagris gallopavo]|uniref:zinc finger CCHC domain-containing protein 7 isoform X1 n=1 Tax=Meleagris gallopavo TaxID=9103 RepID=UPI000549B4F6|nr:zinc finger CCHC domain-containing protein 7 isoform X1 [Meleagris gallopavo]
MFYESEDTEENDGYEDELYREDSSSEPSIDSEVEFHLYSQVHYSQNLAEIGSLEVSAEAEDVAEFTDQSPGVSAAPLEDKNIVEVHDSDGEISDDPEIIILSDTPEEDSVYKSKARKSTSPLAEGKIHTHGSAIADCAKATECNAPYTAGSDREVSRQGPRGKFTPVSSGPLAVQEVMVIDDSPNDEEESMISESENVESWMLLGCSADDKDKDIMLNLEGCGTPTGEGDADVDWSISNKDLEAQICNYASVRRTNVRYYTADKNVTCRNCGRPGHLSKNCPVPKKTPPCCLCAERGHLQNTCPARFCLNCCLPGHYFRECPEKSYWNKHCGRCDMKGHYADACPEIWRQYHLTTNPGPIKAARSHSERSAAAYCYNCSQKGHFGYECAEKRMRGSVFPASPFIHYYDNERDLKRRANRLKRKIAELQEAGLLPVQPETPWQEEKHGGHSCKKKPWEERSKRNKDEHRKKRKSSSQADKQRAKRHRSDVERGHEMEDDFPRGYHKQTSRGSKKHHKSVHQAHGSKEYGQQLLEAAKRKKKRKKQRDASPDINDNLFLIKQRRKRSKQKFFRGGKSLRRNPPAGEEVYGKH